MKRPAWIVALACAVLLTGCVADTDVTTAPTVGSDLIAEIPHQDLSGDPPSRASDDIAPPTNRWYSGMVFGEQPQTVYPFPLAVTPSDTGFALSLPGVAASASSITSAESPVLSVALGATGYEVVHADPVSVTARYVDGADALGEMTLAEGWPVVGFVATSDVALTPSAPLTSDGDGRWTATVGDQTFGVVAPEATWSENALKVPSGSSAQWFVVPADSTMDAWASALGDPVTGVETAHTAGDDITTSLTYAGTDTTIVVPFPGHDGGASCDLGSFDTPYGPAAACPGPTIEWSVPAVTPQARYDFADLDADTAATLAAQVDADLASTEPLPIDSYFGGKALARLAALLEIAQSLDDTDLADRVADRLWEELEPWATPSRCETETDRCFVYDESLRLVVGREPSFGSEEANDHHFHYGHFLTAAAALASYRPETIDKLSPIMDLLAGDIAAGAGDDLLPALRVFDPYRGHSWASGLSPFADGNNQESSSEAVAAWNGLALWAEASGDDDLTATADWLLSSEANAARTLWLEPEFLPDEYTHNIVSLTWGGKRDYATWFSAEPSAILGIQVIPLGPVALEYIASDPERVAANVEEAGGADAASGALGDYVAMYSALGGPDALAQARTTLAALPDDALDDGSSRSAVLAWLAAVGLAQSKAG